MQFAMKRFHIPEAIANLSVLLVAVTLMMFIKTQKSHYLPEPISCIVEKSETISATTGAMQAYNTAIEESNSCSEIVSP